MYSANGGIAFYLSQSKNENKSQTKLKTFLKVI